MPDAPIHPTAIVCASCGGDPRRSATCAQCGGAGVGVPSVDGFLVWSEPVDDFSIVFRRIRRRVTAAFHIAILAFIIAGVGAIIWRITTLADLTTLLARDFWISGSWDVTFFWCSALAICFLIYRLTEFTADAKPLPNWGRPAREETATGEKEMYRFDVAPFFSGAARDVVEAAHHIAKNLNRVEVTPAALFASALASPAGGLFMIRLGMSFDAVKSPIARALGQDPSGEPPIPLGRDTKQALALAYADAREHGRKHVGPIELFLAAFEASPRMQDLLDQLGFPREHVVRVAEWVRLEEKMREDHERFAILARLKPKSAMNRSMTARQTPLLDRFSEDLTLLARDGYLPPIVGREREIAELLRAIESGRRSVVLVGEHGTGRMALIEHLARRMVEEDVPPELFDRRLVAVNMAQVIAGDAALASERLLAVLHEIGMSGNIILVLQNAEALAGGSSRGPMDLAEIFATELDRGYFTAILTTTPRAWTEYLERRTLGSKLAKVDVPEMGVEDTLQALMARSGSIEYQNKVFFSFASLDRAAHLADRYIHDKASPEKALDVIREAAVLARKSRGERTFVSADDVAKIIHERTNIPVEAVSQNETSKLLNLEDRLHARVIGQHEAVTAVSQALRRSRAELREGKRPIANFLFLGPTGVGKTELAKALAAEYFGSESAMIRLDMSEYQDAASIARMIGASGDERGGLLTEAVRHQPFAIVLLDELEKAHPDILNLFLQVMDDGRLTDGVGRTVDFSNTMLIATSNAGTQFIQDEVAKGTPMERIKTAMLERELKGVYRPEFLNRFDGVIVFKPLTQDDVTQIAWLMVNGIAKRLEEKGILFTADDVAVEELSKAGFDPLFGARPLRRLIQERVDNGLADLLLQHKIGRKDTVILEPGGNLRVEKAPSV